MSTLVKEFKVAVESDSKRVAKRVTKFYTDLVSEAPVDTGAFRDAWTIEPLHKMSYVVYNNMNYASILWRGRRKVNGRWYGSEQWKDGGDPLLDTLREDLKSGKI